MRAYARDREFSDGFIPQIKAIVGPRLLCETPDEIDHHQAADLMVFTARDMRIAARVRRPGYAQNPDYRWQFTIRKERDSGAKTELEKILDGWGDWLFYGHSDAQQRIIVWWLLDLDAVRAAHEQMRRGTFPRYAFGDRSNGDGTRFRWFDIREFPDHPRLVIESSGFRNLRVVK
jgi:hypothetical protein